MSDIGSVCVLMTAVLSAMAMRLAYISSRRKHRKGGKARQRRLNTPE